MKTYQLWKDNRLDQEYTATREELTAKFKTWIEAKGIDYVHYYNTERLIRFFLTAPDGMSSVFNESDLVAFIEDLRPPLMAWEKSEMQKPASI